MRRLLKALGLLTVALIVIIAGPILYTETACRGTAIPQDDATYIIDQRDQRPEARTYLTYPEWHIVYAYEGYAEALKTGAPHNFPYLKSIFGFWKSLCALTKKADELGEAGWDSKATIYTIGASFTLEMVGKAVYEETIGRLVAGSASPQDDIETQMADTYATFLQQTPWYKFDFDKWTQTLRAAPTPNFRAKERRVALSLEWKTKAAYARVIAKAVEGVGADELTMKIAVLDVASSSLPNTKLIETKDKVTILEVPRYRVFTRLVEIIANQGGSVQEIAGNDDILVSLVLESGDFYAAQGHTLLSRSARVGFDSERILLSTKVSDLHRVFTDYPNTPVRVEHIYDY